MSPFIEERIQALEARIEELQAQITELQALVMPERRVEAAPETISMAEAARLAGVHRNTIANWVKDGRLEIVERVGREAHVSRADLLRVMEGGE